MIFENSFCFRIIIIVSVVVLCIMTISGTVITMLLNPRQSEYFIPPNLTTLPHFFSVSESYDVFTNDLSFSSISAVTAYVASHYRSIEVTNGVQLSNHFIQLSTQRIYDIIRQYWHVNESIIDSPSTFVFSALNNKTIDVFPEEMCKGFDLNSTCSNNNDKGLGMYINVTSFAQNSKDIRRLLFNSQSPLLLSMPKPLYYDYMFESVMNTGEYFLPNDLGAGSSIDFLVYGYNDDFVMSFGGNCNNPYPKTKGGFIVLPIHSSYRGYPIDYFLGRMSLMNVSRICSNKQIPYYWIGVSKFCIDSQVPLLECLSLPPLDHISLTPTKLKCTNPEYCNLSSTYYVIQNENWFDIEYDDWKMNFYMIEESEDNTSILRVDSIPFEQLYSTFQADTNQFNPEVCKYGFIPYQLIDELFKLNTGKSNRVIALSSKMQLLSGSQYSKLPSKLKTFVDKSKVRIQ